MSKTYLMLISIGVYFLLSNMYISSKSHLIDEQYEIRKIQQNLPENKFIVYLLFLIIIPVTISMLDLKKIIKSKDIQFSIMFILDIIMIVYLIFK